LALKVEHVTVLTEVIGVHRALPNLSVHRIPRWAQRGLTRLGAGFIFNLPLARLLKREKCDVCLIDGAHRWAYRLAPLLRLRGIPVLLWSTATRSGPSLRTAVAAAQRVAVPVRDAFALDTPKAYSVGQGINTQRFDLPSTRALAPEIIYAGPLSANRRVGLMIDAMAYLRAAASDIPWRLKLVGPSVTMQDHIYLHGLMEKVALLGLASHVEFVGALEQQELPRLYQRAFLFFNASPTGSLNKAALEALACGCPLLTTDGVLHQLLADYPDMCADDVSAFALAQRIQTLYAHRADILPAALRAKVTEHYDLPRFADRLLDEMTALLKNA